MSWHDMQQAAPIDQVLAAAHDDKLTDVAIVGRNLAGEIMVYTSHPNADAAIGLLQRGILWLAEREQLANES